MLTCKSSVFSLWISGNENCCCSTCIFPGARACKPLVLFGRRLKQSSYDSYAKTRLCIRFAAQSQNQRTHWGHCGLHKKYLLGHVSPCAHQSKFMALGRPRLSLPVREQHGTLWSSTPGHQAPTSLRGASWCRQSS
jgi:hypothetical protein